MLCFLGRTISFLTRPSAPPGTSIHAFRRPKNCPPWNDCWRSEVVWPGERRNVPDRDARAPQI